jgi:hypothetical protein
MNLTPVMKRGVSSSVKVAFSAKMLVENSTIAAAIQVVNFILKDIKMIKGRLLWSS